MTVSRVAFSPRQWPAQPGFAQLKTFVYLAHVKTTPKDRSSLSVNVVATQEHASLISINKVVEDLEVRARAKLVDLLW